MDRITIKLLGNPTIIFHNETVNFPYKKAEGLFYYICVNKSIAREEAIKIFWIDSNGEVLAKKNLRDALYKIRKLFGKDIFLQTKKSCISLNISKTDIDIDLINNTNIVDLYKGDFLSNFSIKNCLEFEDWMINKRNELKQMYTKKINLLLNEMVTIRDYSRINIYSNILISNDPYNEKTYRDIMKIYALNGNYNYAVKLYFDLCKILKQDLDIEPELSTKNMYKEIIALKDAEALDLTHSSYFYGRFNEIYKALDTFNNFYNDKAMSIVVSGEAGIGKTAYINKVTDLIDKNKFLLLSSNCYSAEKDFFLKPWQSIFSLLGEYLKGTRIKLASSAEQIISYLFPNFNENLVSTRFDSTERIDTTRYQVANEAILDLFLKISCNKKIILVFDDIQWMDEMSKALLKSILFRLGNSNVLLICTYRDDYEKSICDFTVPLISKDLLCEIKLNRFTKNEVEEIVEFQIPNIDNKDLIYDKIYYDTEGNALFLTELIKTIKEKGYTNELSLKATNIIKSRIIDLSEDEKLILNAISIFFDKTDINSIRQIVDFDELKIYEIIEALQAKHLISEIITKNNIYYSYTHQKIREYVYETQSVGKRVLLNRKIALYLNDAYNKTNDSALYSKLIYHFEQSGDIYHTLKYKVEYLKEYYTIYHETFPVISFDFIYDANIQYTFTEQSLIDLYAEIETYSNDDDKQFQSLKMEITFIMGRLYISKGEYIEGLKNIDISKDISIKLENKKYILDNYKQLIFYAIQVHNLNMMKIYIEKIIDIIGTTEINEDVGTILRLYGLYYIKINDCDNATRFLTKSIDIFSILNSSNNKYSLSIAACYNYLGQLNKYINDYETAYEYFIKAIEICNKNYISNGLGIFYSNAGQTLYYLKKIDEAYYYIDKAIDCFNKTSSLWGKDIAECYLCLIEFKRQNNEKAHIYLEEAIALGRKLKNPITLKLIDKIKELYN
ncbi:AAA family ATPase [Sedimentibacter sp. zth1]|uniref:AAA family ATPase n=1 Tax=Sedimentibacter sp. zth1 TaxID=2816908 RepID=UPI001A936021|nr:AAA family ATPase [Sedimentibacter sp. zth1]QSX07035.1 AAA family ATPase [Sedimentibacter sp. zth1]